MYGPGGTRAYAELVDALSALPNARSKIDAMNAILQQALVVPSQVLALSSDFRGMSNLYAGELQAMMATSLRVGTRAEDIVGRMKVGA